VNIKLVMTTGGLALALSVMTPQTSWSQATTPSTGAGATGSGQVGTGSNVPTDPATQGTTDRAGSTPHVTTGTTDQRPSGSVGTSGAVGIDQPAGQGTPTTGDQNRVQGTTNDTADPTIDRTVPGSGVTSGATDRDDASRGVTRQGTTGTGTIGTSGTTGSGGAGTPGATGTSGTAGAQDPGSASATPRRALPDTASTLPVAMLLALGSFAAFGALRLANAEK
jgi:hypothetical protein